MPSDKIGNVATCMTCVSRLDTEPKYVNLYALQKKWSAILYM